MAEALFRHRISQRADNAEWRIESAGTWAVSGYPMEKQARRALARRGVYERTHRSRIVSAELLNGFDLILVMEKGKVVARGTHAELLKPSGLYKEVYSRQLRKED